MLDRIIAYKHQWVKEHEREINLYQSQAMPSSKSFLSALKQNPTAYICEIKLASPSQGIISRDINISQVASIYQPFANAISVLADERFFMGSLANVKKISQEQKCPILCKDIVVSPLQIWQARIYGADAVLLMLSVLDDETYRQCEKIAIKLNMAVICEVHSEEEIMRAAGLKAKIIGINNRNLKTLDIDLATTDRLLKLAPFGSYLISESGFVSHQQIRSYRGRVQAFLVGTSLMRSPRIDLALRELIFGRVKICGLTNNKDAMLAYNYGAYYGGLNFSTQSPRCVSLEEAKAIMKDVPLSFGGVFVNQALDEVISISRTLNLDFIQLHGDEEKDYINQLRDDISPDCQIWRALSLRENMSVTVSRKVDVLVFDHKDGYRYGGTGQRFDWSLLKNLPLGLRFAVAGGINSENICEADSLGAFIIDIASGSEDDHPRQKSASQLEKIFKHLRG